MKMFIFGFCVCYIMVTVIAYKCDGLFMDEILIKPIIIIFYPLLFPIYFFRFFFFRPFDVQSWDTFIQAHTKNNTLKVYHLIGCIYLLHFKSSKRPLYDRWQLIRKKDRKTS